MDDKRIDIKNKLDSGLTFKISRFKEQIKKTTPHKHDEYYELIFLEQGEGFHTIEAEKYVIAVPDFFFLKPGQLHYWQFTSIPKGYVLLLKENEFDLIKESILVELFKKLSAKTRTRLDAWEPYSYLLLGIEEEYKNSTVYSKEIIHGLIKVLIGKILQLNKTLAGSTAPTQTPFDRFQNVLIKECPHWRKVYQYADALNMTPQNLNAICRKQSGLSASEWITRQVMLEAKRYILHTTNTINEIAEVLSFSDTSNFVKFFRKNEGVTPQQFRKKYFQ